LAGRLIRMYGSENPEFYEWDLQKNKLKSRLQRNYPM
jgi:hypothetical protein